MKARCRFPRPLRGVAAIELAILLVPLVVMTFGMSELGRAFYHYNTLLKSTRDAVRYLSMQPPGQGEAIARCLAVQGKAQAACGTGDPLVPGLTPDMVSFGYGLQPLGNGLGSVNVVTVTISGYSLHPAVPVPVSELLFGPVSNTMRQGSS